jgi:erythromycin esterase-like protein
VITRRLIEEKGFQAVAVEADWPDAYRVNRFVRGIGEDTDAVSALADFRRFPAWMWRNGDVVEFIALLRHLNLRREPARRAGFYGLDLYSLHASMEKVVEYLDKVDPEAAQRARSRYGCFDHFGDDSQEYGYATSLGVAESCEKEVLSQLVELRRRAGELAGRDGRVDADEFFFAEQNARVVKNAEQYYRTMFTGRVSSWNLRDSHMFETLETLAQHLGGSSAKIVVWAHNSHLGDARATDMGRIGEHNLGQLVRQGYGEAAYLAGFSTYSGTVTAASQWGGDAERKRVRPGLRGSYEALLHQVSLAGAGNFGLRIRDHLPVAHVLERERLERAIGVIYLPETERRSHYFEANMARQFDAVLHFDESRGVEPLERTSVWTEGEPPETYPTAL